MDQEETAQIAQSSAEELLHEAAQAEVTQPEQKKGVIDKVKDTLTGQ